MLTRLFRAALPAVLSAMFGLPLAHADIYTWVDASGAINISNLAPPEGTQVTKVVHESAPATAARDEAAREAARRAEVQALAERVRQLEDEIEFAGRRQMPPPMEYRAIPPPPVVQYFVDMAPSAAQYSNVAPPANPGCDPSWAGCGLWWAPGFYPATVVVLGAPNFPRFHPVNVRHRFASQQPVRGPGNLHRG